MPRSSHLQWTFHIVTRLKPPGNNKQEQQQQPQIKTDREHPFARLQLSGLFASVAHSHCYGMRREVQTHVCGSLAASGEEGAVWRKSQAITLSSCDTDATGVLVCTLFSGFRDALASGMRLASGLILVSHWLSCLVAGAGGSQYVVVGCAGGASSDATRHETEGSFSARR